MAPKSVPKVSNLSREFIQDSSEDGEAETADVAASKPSPSPSPAKTSTKQSARSSKIAQVARQAKTPVSREEDDDEEQEDGEEDDGEEEEEEDNDEEYAEDDGEGGEDDEAGAAGMVDEAADDGPSASAQANRKRKSVSSTSRKVPAKPFEPPTGFEKLELDLPNGDFNFTELLSSGMAGKQIWHITAPSDVSISTIKKFKIDANAKASTLEIEGQPYTFTAGSASNKVLLHLDANEHDYRPAQGSIARTFRIQEVFNPLLPRGDAGELPTKKMRFTCESTSEVAARPIRQQPAGLGPHFTAVGVVENSSKTGARDAGKDKFHIPPALPSPSPSSGDGEPEPRSDAQTTAEARQSTDSDAEAQPQQVPEPVKGKAQKQKQALSKPVPVSAAKEHKEQWQGQEKAPKSGKNRRESLADQVAESVPGKKERRKEQQGRTSSAQPDAASNKKPGAMDVDERPAILPPGYFKHQQTSDRVEIAERPAILPPGYVKPRQTADLANGTSTAQPRRRKKKSTLPDE